MKKILSILTLCALCAVGTLSAQVSIRAGYSDMTVKIKSNGKTSSETYNGCYIGAAYNFNIGSIGIEPALHLNYNVWSDENDYDEETWKWMDIVIPININYSYSFTPLVKLTVLVGPSINFGILNKLEIEDKYYNSTYDVDVYDDSDVDYPMRRLGLDLNAGLRLTLMRHFGIEANYTIGLTNRADTDDSDNSLKTNRLNLGIVYTF